ncbi:hypothetical protein [Geosporobacter ferrireducens]|uniref:Uncharacterized protein n=1 Tax=Geosporobacter ferrireducens TaxID=1424294 RepID=A0A1D8GFU2_9FIRM|nr:hypothetical protein [Geosporobacter ferrireducens]AOT69774.1 hypothetical protein Gferi_09365 [Geosporobacter ferrireducens]MTI54513.1 hypothetical protein [Geosporobacter ferrireducens]
MLAPLGLGIFGFTLASRLAPYRNLFIFITAVLLFFAYRIIEKNPNNRNSKIIFWLSVLLVVFLLYYPTLSAWMVRLFP